MQVNSLECTSKATGMSKKVEGPASGTRSRKNSEINRKLILSPDSKRKQRLVSSFFIDRDRGCASDLDTKEYNRIYVCSQNKLRARSDSGNIYSSTVEINTSVNMAENGVNTGAMTPTVGNFKSFTLGGNSIVTTIGGQTTAASSQHHTDSTCVTTALNKPLSSVNPDCNLAGANAIHSQTIYQQSKQHDALQSATDTTNIKEQQQKQLDQTDKTNMGPVVHEERIINGPKQSTVISQQTDTATMYTMGTTTNPASTPSITTKENPENPMMALMQAMNEKLSNIQAHVRSVHSEVQSLKDSKTDIYEQITGIQFDQEDDHEVLIIQQNELRQCQDQVALLTNIVSKYEGKITELSNKITAMEARSMHSELIITGLQDKEKKSPLETVREFFKEQMEIEEDLNIVYVYWKGKGKNTFKPLVVRFTTPAFKSKVFSNVSKLKGKKNSKGRTFRVADHLPEEHRTPEEKQTNIPVEQEFVGWTADSYGAETEPVNHCRRTLSSKN